MAVAIPVYSDELPEFQLFQRSIVVGQGLGLLDANSNDAGDKEEQPEQHANFFFRS